MEPGVHSYIRDSEQIAKENADAAARASARKKLVDYLIGKRPIVFFKWTDFFKRDATPPEGVVSFSDLKVIRKFRDPLDLYQAGYAVEATGESSSLGIDYFLSLIWANTDAVSFKPVDASYAGPRPVQFVNTYDMPYVTVLVFHADVSIYHWYTEEQCRCTQRDHRYQPSHKSASRRADRGCICCKGYGTHTLPVALALYKEAVADTTRAIRASD